jgi:hypothetical protein
MAGRNPKNKTGGKPAKDGIPILDAIGEEAIFEDRAGGASTRDLQKKYGVTVSQFYFWLGYSQGARIRAVDAEGLSRRDRWDVLTAHAAESRAARATERLEALVEKEGEREGRMKTDVSREEIALVKALVEQDRWEAGNMDPGTFRQNTAQPAPQVNISVGDLYLAAVRAEGGGAALGGAWKTPVTLADPDVTDVDAEEVRDNDDEVED